MTWKVQRGLPVRTSKACTSPGAWPLTSGRSLMLPPAITTSPHTCGPLELVKVVARAPRPAFKFVRPPEAQPLAGLPVAAWSELRVSAPDRFSSAGIERFDEADAVGRVEHSVDHDRCSVEIMRVIDGFGQARVD